MTAERGAGRFSPMRCFQMLLMAGQEAELH